MLPLSCPLTSKITAKLPCVHGTIISIFLLFSLQFACVFAQLSLSPSPSPTTIPLPSPSPQSFNRGRLFYVSNEGRMAKILQKETDFIEASYTLQRHFSNVEQGIMKSLLEKRPPPANQSLHPCNSDGRGYKQAMVNFLANRQLPEPDISCITAFEGVHNSNDNGDSNRAKESSKQTSTTINTKLTEDDVYNAIITRGNQLYANSKEIAKQILGNWSNPDVNIHYLYNTATKKCILNHVGGLRISNKWYIFTTITNAPRRLSVPLFQRQWLNEFLHVEHDKTIAPALKFGVHERPPDNSPNINHTIRYDTTDSLSMSRGSGRPFAFTSMYIENNPALKSAMEKIDLDIQQADDAVAPSSLAILLLPLTLSVIPLALLTDPFAVTRKFNFMYALMTDIVTVIPLAIKGGELIKIGLERHRSVFLRITGAVNGTLSESAAVVLWGAECRAQDNVLPTGIAFFCTAVLFMIIGISLEIVGRAWVVKRQVAKSIIEPSTINSLQSIPTSIQDEKKVDFLDEEY